MAYPVTVKQNSIGWRDKQPNNAGSNTCKTWELGKRRNKDNI